MHKNKQNNSNKPTFFVYPKRKSSGLTEATLYMRVAFQFNEIEKSLGIKIPFDKWDSEKRVVKEFNYHQRELEDRVAEFKEKIMGAFYVLSKNTAEPTLREIMDMAFDEEGKSNYSLFGVFSDLLIKMEKQNTLKRQRSNLLKYQTCMRHLKNFVKQKYKVNDLSFNRINRNFIDEFELFLQSECKNGHNSSMKLLQIFRRVYMVAVNNRWTSHNAFFGKKLTYIDVDIQVLTDDELQALKILNIEKEHLLKTRKMFLFCVYTGLAYIDLFCLKRKHIELNKLSSSYMIRKKREKTGVEALIPLFEPAKQILNEWIPNWEKLNAEEFLTPRISNQKFNDNIRDLIALLGLDKRIRSHSGRHTFATTIALENGVGIETVSKMLGHSKIAQTQKYAKVTALKIERETMDLSNKLKL